MNIFVWLTLLIPPLPVFAEAVHQVTLDVHLSEDLLLTRSREEVETALKNKILSSESCINAAFAAAGSEIQLRLLPYRVHWMTKEEVARLSQSPYEPDRSATGQPVLTSVGSSSQNFTVRFYSVPVNHVPFAFTPKTLAMIAEPEVALLLGEIASGGDLKNVNRKTLAKLHSLKPGNLVRIHQSELFQSENGRWNVIPHELMHAIGGLEDNYVDSSHTAPNLMGAYRGGNECVFSKAQVQSFEKNRSLAVSNPKTRSFPALK